MNKREKDPWDRTFKIVFFVYALPALLAVVAFVVLSLVFGTPGGRHD